MFSPFTERTARQVLGITAGAALAVLAYVGAVLYLLYGVERSSTGTLLLAAGLTVPGYLVAARFPAPGVAFWLGLGLRAAAVFAFPLLSDDVYRFLWDGALWWEGIHPLSETPSSLALSAQGAAFAKTHDALLTTMNSRDYYTVYPPGSQLVFAVAGAIATQTYWASVLLKACLLVGELALWRQLRRGSALVESEQLGARLYWLSPLSIVEVCGNGHFEGLAVLGAIVALTLLRGDGLERVWRQPKAISRHRQGGPITHQIAQRPRARSLALAGAAFAGGVLVKLVPLLLAPAMALACLWRRGDQAVDRRDSGHPSAPASPESEPGAGKSSGPLVGRNGDEEGEASKLRLDAPPHVTPQQEWPEGFDGHVPDEWPYGHPFEVVPPSTTELAEMRRIEGELRAARAFAAAAKDQAPHLDPQVPPAPRPSTSRPWDWRSAVLFATTVALVVALVLGTFVATADVTGFGESLDLYFRNFEFNGSLYALASAIGSAYRGWNWIAVVGPGMSLLALAGILAVAFVRQWRGADLAETLLWCMTVYLACATTVHPWYFLYLLALGSLTRYRWPFVLGGAAFFSYAAYGADPIAVPTWALLLEYAPAVLVGGWEIGQHYKNQAASAKIPYSAKNSAHSPR